MGTRMTANMEKVLRAMDVIPPFDNDQASSRRAGAVPTLDLGEKILAEQRRMTARKRKAPGMAEGEEAAVQAGDDVADVGQSIVPEGEVAGGTVWARGVSDEVEELHRIVADIVARDIDRLCEGLKRDSCRPV
jgi:hypothetical protein